MVPPRPSLGTFQSGRRPPSESRAFQASSPLPAVPHARPPDPTHPAASAMSPAATACATPAAARPLNTVPTRRSPPSAARPPSPIPARRSAGCCFCASSSSSASSPSTWDWTRWSRHFDEVDQAESYASLLQFQLEEAVENEDFAEAAKLKRDIIEATGNDAVAHVMSELKSAIEEQRYQDASRLTRLAGTSLVGWWVGYAKGIDDSIGRIVRISPGVGRYVAKSYSPRQLVTASSGTPLFEIFLVREDDKTYTMKVVHLRPTKGTSGASSISSAITESPATVETPESSAISDSITEEANIDTPVKGNGDAEEKEQDVGSSKDTSVDGFKSLLNFLKSRIPEFKVQVINVDVSEETELAANSSEESVQDDVKSTPEGSLEEPTTEELEQEEDVPEEDMDEESKSTKVKLFISGVVHNKEDAGTKSYVRVPAEINNMEKDSFDLYIPGNGSGHDLPETKAAKQKVADMAAKLASELMPSDVAKALWGTTKSSSKINKEVQELLRLTLSKARVKLTDNTFFNRIIMDTNSMDPFNGLYVGAFSPYGPEIVQLRRKFGHWNSSDDVEFFEYVEAVKLTGDLSVPAGQITFRAKIGKGKRLENRGAYPEEFGVIASYKGQGRIAQPGFKNPRWVDGELLVLNGKSTIPHLGGAELGFLYSVPEQSFLVLFDRLNLPEC
ncbi:Protein EXECUTER 2, chloroplastic [Zea mays]|uniref:Protein EXECUTER 2, chloroplastic n=2 Tax=Zea mays TaxID=4577 RepID=A0A3L6FLK2_MAIZE|nr:Protein EXECUTER 2, chloroplastic [Zea mays]